ncbi:hypothetical protein ACFY93_02090 [Streptomyces sp. NPDC008313]|uniref:hypothetical protein n=1 Tax=Streptomyces sp. NPDC008313 TaxID=3364826 RepID=UPI0036EE5D7A
MGRFWDKLTGTRYPGGNARRLAPAEVTAALLALNGPQTPFQVRAAEPGEKKVDLVVECHSRRAGVRIKVSMRLVPETYEVRVLQERWENRSSENAGKQYSRGHGHAVYRQFEYQRDPDGKRRKVEFRFDTRQVIHPLQRVVLGAGWTWRGVFRR